MLKTPKLKVLYIEDNRSHVSLMQKVFQHIEDVELKVAFDGITGRDVAKQLKPDLLLIDINLPRLSGLDIAKQLRAMPDFQQTPMFAITADVMTHHKSTILNAGIDKLISKPINVKQLIKLINNAA